MNPLRLATGNHKPGTGLGCAMNVISWENGDTTITDFPGCSDMMLSCVVQVVNDTICRHSEHRRLCATCSIAVLTLAHRTVGTGAPCTDARRRLWVRLALDEARSVEQHHQDAKPLNDVTEGWLHGSVGSSTLLGITHDADSFANFSDSYDEHFAKNAARAGALFAAAASTFSFADSAPLLARHAVPAVTAAANAVRASKGLHLSPAEAAAGDPLLVRAHKLIDRYERYTGTTPVPVPAAVTQHAITRMLVVA